MPAQVQACLDGTDSLDRADPRGPCLSREVPTEAVAVLFEPNNRCLLNTTVAVGRYLWPGTRVPLGSVYSPWSCDIQWLSAFRASWTVFT